MQWNKRGFILISIYNDSSKLQKLHSTRFALRVPKLEALFCSWSADDGDDHVWSIHPLFGNPLSGFVARSAAERHNATRRHPSLHRPLSLIHSFYWRRVVLLKLSRRPHHFWEASSAKELPPRSESSFVCARLADRCTYFAVCVWYFRSWWELSLGRENQTNYVGREHFFNRICSAILTQPAYCTQYMYTYMHRSDTLAHVRAFLTLKAPIENGFIKKFITEVKATKVTRHADVDCDETTVTSTRSREDWLKIKLNILHEHACTDLIELKNETANTWKLSRTSSLLPLREWRHRRLSSSCTESLRCHAWSLLFKRRIGVRMPHKTFQWSSSYALHLWNEGIQIYATIWPFFVVERKKFLMKIPQPPRQPYLTILLIIPLVMTGLAAVCTQNSLYTFAFRLQSQNRRCRVSPAIHKYCVT